MTATAISNSLSLPQIQSSTRKQAGIAATNVDPGRAIDAAQSNGQNLPTATSPTAMQGWSSPVLSSNTTALLLKMQEAQRT